MLLKRRNINKDMISLFLGGAYSTVAAIHKEAFVVIATRDKQEPRGRDNNFTIKREHEEAPTICKKQAKNYLRRALVVDKNRQLFRIVSW